MTRGPNRRVRRQAELIADPARLARRYAPNSAGTRGSRARLRAVRTSWKSTTKDATARAFREGALAPPSLSDTPGKALSRAQGGVMMAASKDLDRAALDIL